MWTSTIFAVTIFAISAAIGDVVSLKTKGIVVGLLFSCLFYMAGYMLGIIPSTTPADTGIVALLGAFGTMLIITNMGTTIELNKFLEEWKTVLVCLGGLAALAAILIPTMTVLFGREMALAALPPVSGGTIAAVMIADVANPAGRPDITVFAALLVTLQNLVGVPFSSFMLGRYCNHCIKSNALSGDVNQQSKIKPINIRIFKDLPSSINTPAMIIAKVLIVTLLSQLLSKVVPIPSAVLALILAILFTELGLVDRNALQKAGMANFIMWTLACNLIPGFATLTPELLVNMLLPILAALLIGAAALSIGGALVGRLFLKMDASLGAALALTAMFGFPCTLMIANDVVKTRGLSEEQSEVLMDHVMPKMIIAGFTTVTISSVMIASVVAPMIFG